MSEANPINPPTPTIPDNPKTIGGAPRLGLRGSVPVMELLASFGPGHTASVVAGGCPAVTQAEALAYCRELAGSHYENFSVLSSLVPEHVRPDFAAVYAFCRWADDLGDETGSLVRPGGTGSGDGTSDGLEATRLATELLDWWLAELDACYAGAPRHPVYIALWPTIQRHGLPRQLFADLISAFRQDQTVTRYQTWDQLVDYCSRSANPVGRLVLYLAGHRPENDPPITTGPDGTPLGRFACSDLICTALQLTNFWQDVQRDLLERDRVYLPELETGWTAEKLRAGLADPNNPELRVSYIHALRPLVNRTGELFRAAEALPEHVTPGFAPVIWLFGAGGRAVLAQIERGGCTTLWHRPKLSKLQKAMLVGRAYIRFKLGSGSRGRGGFAGGTGEGGGGAGGGSNATVSPPGVAA